MQCRRADALQLLLLIGGFRFEDSVGPDLIGIDMRQPGGTRSYPGDVRADVASRPLERDFLMRRETRPGMLDFDKPEAAMLAERPGAQVKFDFADHVAPSLHGTGEGACWFGPGGSR